MNQLKAPQESDRQALRVLSGKMTKGTVAVHCASFFTSNWILSIRWFFWSLKGEPDSFRHGR
jgi:hypothetical protein